MIITQGLGAAAAPLARVREPVDGLSAASLDLRLRAAHVELRAGDLGDVLIDFAGHGPVLTVDRPGGRVRARRARSWFGPRPPDVDVLLNSRLPWTVRARGAGLCGRLDLRRLRLNGLELSAADGAIRIDLPAPDGAVLVRLRGRGALARFTVSEGTCVRFWQEDGWQVEGYRSSGPVAVDRYDVWLDGRAGRCVVETRQTESTDVPHLHVLP